MASQTRSTNTASARPRPQGNIRASVIRIAKQPFSSKILAAMVVTLIAMRIQLPQGLTVGYLAAAVLIPVWFRTLRQFRGATSLLVIGVCCLVSGIWLDELARGTHAVSAGESLSISIGLAGILCSVGFVLWARQVLSDSWVAIWFGIGLVLGVSATSPLFFTNPWRFGFSFGLTVFVLAIAYQTRRPWLGLVATLALAVVSTLTDARSTFAMLMLTAILVGWQLRSSRPTRTKSALLVIIAMAALAVVVYNLGQEAIVAGYFGEATRDRTVAQLNMSGSLILGGRPEIAATIALMQFRPWGYGAGTLPGPEDILAAKSGMAAINYEPNNGYVESYMFGGHIELHSVVGDLWSHFGIPGLILAGLILVILLRGVGVAIAAKTASAVLIFLVVDALWALFFGPVYSGARLLIIALGLAMLRREPEYPRAAELDAVDRIITGARPHRTGPGRRARGLIPDSRPTGGAR